MHSLINYLFGKDTFIGISYHGKPLFLYTSSYITNDNPLSNELKIAQKKNFQDYSLHLEDIFQR